MSEPAEGGRHRRPEGGEAPGDNGGPARIGAEDVLAGPPPAVAPAERRRDRPSPWSRPRDRVIVVLIVVVAVVAGVVVWAGSASRATIQETSAPGTPLPPSPPTVPATLRELWQAPSSAAPVPIAEGTAVATAEGGEIAGRDPMTGDIRWRYSRDLPLCTATEVWGRVLAVFRKDGVNGESGCSEVIGLAIDTGQRKAQRTGSAQLGTGLVTDGSQVTATGPDLLVTWRDDLVETNEYGRVPALINPDKQPRTGCTYGSVAMASSRIGVIERCPGDPGDRLTVMKSVPKEADQPQVSFSAIMPGRDAKVVAMSGNYTAVAMPHQKLLVLYDEDGEQTAAYPLDLPGSDLAQDPEGRVAPTTSTTSNVYWFTGSKMMALSRDDLTPLWTLNGAVGPGVTFAHQLVVPIEGGLAVLNESDGSTIRTIAVDRHGYTGPVRLTAMGPVLLEQRGDTLVALS
ncbi:hypothetical protein GCM10027445_65830 [Amycolatopsis endophytica]|uniref:Uncharacterized protein n=1 Tax=Amycolatopsis endophytica TaxID=860233 RepID=A0A853AXW3_9PSEU|nr:PQQ-binding-like beta-propeller repeat protein [Amycolatopsis endophytica]NYI87454.1 hypothetical protein [Amycolatopsis endophytica]